jgi:hypothetical protein
MDAQAAETAIKAFIKDILERFERAVGVAKAGQVGLPECRGGSFAALFQYSDIGYRRKMPRRPKKWRPRLRNFFR